MSAVRGIVVAGLAMLGACATLRIDVDVYKGPLANDKEIQIREITSLAIGSKPLLIEVRDVLEWRARSWTLGEWRRRPEYRAGEMATRRADGTRTFCSPEAEVANGILGLFRDVEESAEFGRQRRELRELIEGYRGAYEVINAEGGQGRIDQELLDRIEAARHAMRGDLADATGGRMTALRPFLMLDQGSYRDSSSILCVLDELDSAHPELWITDRLAPGGNREQRVALHGLDAKEWRSIGANVCYTILARPATWDRIVEVVPETERELRDEIRARGVAIARAFLDARTRLRAIMIAAADLAIEAAVRQPTLDGAVDLAEAALVVSVACISRSALDAFLMFAEEDDVSAEAFAIRGVISGNARLKEAIEANGMPGIAGTRELVRHLLDALVTAGPLARGEAVRKVAAAIGDVDRWCALVAPQEEEQPDENIAVQSVQGTRQFLRSEVGGPAARAMRFAFGLATGPVASEWHKGAAFTSSIDLVRGLTNLGDDHGLGGGRHPRGIDSLTTAYLTANGGERERLQRDLLTTIIQFGVKIRLLSGMQPLVDGGGDASSYVDVLQAIANSIITQADALQRETGLLDSITESELRRVMNLAETALEKTARRDAALQLLGATDPPKRSVVAGELDAGRTLFLSKDDEAKLASPRAVMTELSRRLRYAIAGETARDKDSPALLDLRAALEFVEEQLTQTVYLRAAAAYLRNSYPAPDLQSDPLHLQDRILTGQAGRLVGPRREVAERLDKQYWQNVNSIELGGVGQTNYAVIKDDIGNWQIKSYDADSSKLVHTLASLARLATSAGVPAAAVAGAAELQKLLGKVRKGDALTEEQKKRLNAIEKERASSGAESMATQSAIRSSTQRATELNAELRAWMGGELVDATITKLGLDAASDEAKELGGAIRAAIPGGSQPPADATELARFEHSGQEFGALRLALAQTIPDALTDATKKAAMVEAARTRLVDARTRRLDLLRGLELALLDEPEPEPASAGH